MKRTPKKRHTAPEPISKDERVILNRILRNAAKVRYDLSTMNPGRSECTRTAMKHLLEAERALAEFDRQTNVPQDRKPDPWTPT